MPKEYIRLDGLAGVLKTLQQLPAEIVSKKGGPVRKVLRRAANVIKDEAKKNVQAIIDTPNADGLIGPSTGKLRDNIRVIRRDFKGGLNGERMVVFVRRVFYKNEKGEKVHTRKVGALLERGTEKRAPMPWMRPAYDAKRVEAVRLFETQLPKEIKKIQRKLERLNKVKQ